MIEFWRSHLSESFKKQYDVLLDAIKQRRRSVALNRTLDIVNEIQKIYSCILSDHPELYYASPQIAIAMSVLSLNANLSYLYDEMQRREIDKSFEELQNALAKESNKTDIEKAYTATFLIMKNSRYEVNHLYNQNAASAIHYHAAQCSGFASAFKCAMDLMGIWCIVVSGSISSAGQSGPHSWNIVKLNDAYYHIDITPLANISVTDIDLLYRYNLFESDAQKKQKGYVWNSLETPICSEMKMPRLSRGNDSFDNEDTANTEKVANDNGNFPTFTRLFDVQAKIKECLKNKITRCDFMLDIPVYSDEKLVRLVSNYLSEQGQELSVLYEAETGFENGRFYFKIKYNN